MISVDRVYQTIRSILNTNIRGNIDPPTIRLHINQAVNEIREELFSDLNRALNRENRGLVNIGSLNLSENIRAKIMHYYEETDIEFTTNSYQMPNDVRLVDIVLINDVEVEIMKRRSEYNLLKTRASNTFPICFFSNGEIKISPNNSSTIHIGYLRKHKIANWTFKDINGAEVFNPSSPNFQDIDMHPSEESNVVLKVLKYSGLNLKEQDIQAFAYRESNRDLNQELAN